MRTQVETLLKENQGMPLVKVAEKMNVTFTELLDFAPNSRKYPVEKIEELFTILRTWEKVFLLVITDGFVMEISDKFPKGFHSHGYLNFNDKNSSIGGHLSVDKIKSIYLVDDFMFGRRSCSIKFYDENKKEIFAIYVPRDERKKFIEKCIESFESII